MIKLGLADWPCDVILNTLIKKKITNILQLHFAFSNFTGSMAGSVAVPQPVLLDCLEKM